MSSTAHALEGSRNNYPTIDNYKSNMAIPSFVGLNATLEAVAPTSASVLVLGETGTGKEVIAHALHEKSRRRQGPFIAINAGAIPEQLIESELFGYERGAFTGASGQKPGQIELAHNGTLFLDEIGDMPLNSQTRLLRVLEQGEVRRLGGQRDIKVDVKIIAATNQSLLENAKEKKFRADLYYRLNVFEIDILPLRKRIEDVPHLAVHFLKESAKVITPNQAEWPNVEKITLTPGAHEELQSYPWPGNVRELRNVVTRLVIKAWAVQSREIGLREVHEMLKPQVTALCKDTTSARDAESQIKGKTWEQIEHEVGEKKRAALVWALQESGGSQSGAARLLKMGRDGLRNQMSKFGLLNSDPFADVPSIAHEVPEDTMYSNGVRPSGESQKHELPKSEFVV